MLFSKLPLSIGVRHVSGLDSENAMTMINGVSMNKSYDGRPQWVGRTKRCHPKSEFTIGTAPSDYTLVEY
jgi:hypothetical protein